MKVKDVMTQESQVLWSKDTLAQVVESMWERECGILPTVDKTNRVTGVLTDRDVALGVWRKDRAPRDIGNFVVPAQDLNRDTTFPVLSNQRVEN
jgi:CBS domain-containing protein